MIITIAHARQALGKGNRNACNRGINTWCKSHDIDFKHFVKNGMNLADAELINDPIVKRIIQVAKNG